MTVKKKAGFTLSELLIVVAIIGVLVAISIPIFTQQIHKAEVATDWANVRSYYAQLQYDFMETGTIDTKYLNEWDGNGNNGLTSFSLNGQTVTLKTGSLWVAPEDKDKKHGYNILYICNKGYTHTECALKLPEDNTPSGTGK